MSATFLEGQQVLLLEDSAIGTVDYVREDLDPDTDRPRGETSYDVLWADTGECSTHLESELVALTED